VNIPLDSWIYAALIGFVVVGVAGLLWPRSDRPDPYEQDGE